MPRMLPILAAVFLLVLVSGAPEGLASRYVSPDLENKVAFALAAFSAGIALMFAITKGLSRIINATLSGWPIIAFVALAGISRYWSSAPSETLQAAIHLMFLSGAAICLAAYADWRELLAGSAIAILLLALLSAALIPGGGLMSEIHPGALRGPWGEKNEAGMIFAFGALCFVALSFATHRYPWLLGAFGLLPFIILTQSTTALLAFAAGLFAMFGIELIKGRPTRLIIGSWLAVVIIAGASFLFMTSAGDLIEAAGKDVTLTGRSAIWPAVLDRISERPWLGHGYSAFWVEDAPSKMWLWTEIHFKAHNAHNGLLETLLGLGVAGTVLLFCLVARTLVYSIIGASRDNDPRRFALPLLLALLVISVSESIMSGPDGLLWFMFIVLSVSAPMKPANHHTPISNMRLYAGRARTLSSHAFVAGVPSNPKRASAF